MLAIYATRGRCDTPIKLLYMHVCMHVCTTFFVIYMYACMYNLFIFHSLSPLSPCTGGGGGRMEMERRAGTTQKLDFSP